MKKTKTVLMRNVELEKGATLEELIEREVEAGHDLSEAALALGISYHTLRSWMPDLGIRLKRVVVLDRSA